MNERVQIIVARHQEDASWVERLGYPSLVYDKSGQPGPWALANIGRETHTYLHHILRAYPDFADYNVFLQAQPFFHMGPQADPQTLKQAIEGNLRLGVKFTGFAWYKLKCDRLGRPHDMAKPENQGKWAGWGRDIPVGQVYEHLFQEPGPEQFVVSAPAGMFFVARERILARPLAFYQRAMALVEADPQDEFNTGHAFERLWPMIFSGKEQGNDRTNPG
jgi:hypothetical protein